MNVLVCNQDRKIVQNGRGCFKVEKRKLWVLSRGARIFMCGDRIFSTFFLVLLTSNQRNLFNIFSGRSETSDEKLCERRKKMQKHT